MEETTERYLSALAAVAAATLGDDLVGCYLHGSAALGGFDARRSDVDVLVVSAGTTGAAQRSALAAALEQLPCPAAGLDPAAVAAFARRVGTHLGAR
ncbi:hypothetical protein Athai_58960 [Actinocatenispora thailandica]|uniref:Nucleotidyltransferase domain-containing protein n=1 Tax=Actinocatenispora thailandica TaxID=227318 RepID=A0A7R7I0U5_9ACTN|nr:hypothetical protein [Actinocatenispora thailandica]BCJ38393.1 hypothetical protein Athai_58960 [Actinocatenispora thailandica]